MRFPLRPKTSDCPPAATVRTFYRLVFRSVSPVVRVLPQIALSLLCPTIVPSTSVLREQHHKETRLLSPEDIRHHRRGIETYFQSKFSFPVSTTITAEHLLYIAIFYTPTVPLVFRRYLSHANIKCAVKFFSLPNPKV